jgi:ketosteroid isomerase-like protein
VARAIRQAKAALAAGKNEEAAQAAAEAQALDRGNREARQILARIASIEREHVGRAAAMLTSAKSAAIAANARELTPGLFAAAEKQEAAAHDANARQQYAAAAARLEAAVTLYHSAEATARGEAEARAARARTAEEQRRLPAPPSPAPAPAKPDTATKAEPAATPPPAPLPSRSEPLSLPPQTRTARDAAAAILQRYVGALEHRDIAALKAVWPSLGGAQQSAMEAEFANARSIDVEFVDPKVDVSGNSATVTGRRRYSLRTRDGQQLHSETITTLTLRQVGNDWVIESVRHQATR